MGRRKPRPRTTQSLTTKETDMKPFDELHRIQVGLDELRYRVNLLEGDLIYVAQRSPPSYPFTELTIKQTVAQILDYLNLKPIFHHAYWQLLSDKEKPNETP